MIPPKHEWVIKCKMSSFQKEVYEAFLKYRENNPSTDTPREGGGPEKKESRKNLLAAFHISQMIVNHPDILCVYNKIFLLECI